MWTVWLSEIMSLINLGYGHSTGVFTGGAFENIWLWMLSCSFSDNAVDYEVKVKVDG